MSLNATWGPCRTRINACRCESSTTRADRLMQAAFQRERRIDTLPRQSQSRRPRSRRSSDGLRKAELVHVVPASSVSSEAPFSVTALTITAAAVAIEGQCHDCLRTPPAPDHANHDRPGEARQAGRRGERGETAGARRTAWRCSPARQARRQWRRSTRRAATGTAPASRVRYRSRRFRRRPRPSGPVRSETFAPVPPDQPAGPAGRQHEIRRGSAGDSRGMVSAPPPRLH